VSAWFAHLWDHGHSRFSGIVLLALLGAMCFTSGLAGLETFFWWLDWRQARRRRRGQP
jgi:hypothetical protein